MTGLFYLVAAIAVFWLGLWVAEDDQTAETALKALQKTAPWSPFAFREPVSQAPSSSNEQAPVPKREANWRQRAKDKKS